MTGLTKQTGRRESSVNVAEIIGYSLAGGKKLDPYFILNRNINSNEPKIKNERQKYRRFRT